jgi:FK506-binding protein 2
MKITLLLALATAAIAGEIVNNDVSTTRKPHSRIAYWHILQHLKTEVVTPAECSRKTKAGDKINVHYRGTLESDGSEFDASYNRGQPLSFTVGQGQVIKGWDQGLLDMCPGEKRKLTIQPAWAYGSRGAGPIPANSVLSKSYRRVMLWVWLG